MTEPSPRASTAPSTEHPRRFGWHRLTRTLMVIGVALACLVLLYVFAHHLPVFGSISKSAMYVVGAVALLYIARAWWPRHGQRRHGERRHNGDRRDE